MPNRRRITASSRGLSEPSARATSRVISLRPTWLSACGVSRSGMKSPRRVSPSPIGCSRETTSWKTWIVCPTLSLEVLTALATSLREGCPPSRLGDPLIRFGHVHGHPDGAGLIRQRAGDPLADPPGGIGAELEPTPVVESLRRLHQAHIAFLDEVQKTQAPAIVV